MSDGAWPNLTLDEVVAQELSRLRSIATALGLLHKPQTRYSPAGYEDVSFDSVAAAMDYVGENVTVDSFEVCEECGRLEMGEPEENPRAYKESLWPCATALALGVSHVAV